MRKLLLLIVLFAGAVNAQEFDFGCEVDCDGKVSSSYVEYNSGGKYHYEAGNSFNISTGDYLLHGENKYEVTGTTSRFNFNILTLSPNPSFKLGSVKYSDTEECLVPDPGELVGLTKTAWGYTGHASFYEQPGNNGLGDKMDFIISEDIIDAVGIPLYINVQGTAYPITSGAWNNGQGSYLISSDAGVATVKSDNVGTGVHFIYQCIHSDKKAYKTNNGKIYLGRISLEVLGINIGAYVRYNNSFYLINSIDGEDNRLVNNIPYSRVTTTPAIPLPNATLSDDGEDYDVHPVDVEYGDFLCDNK